MIGFHCFGCRPSSIPPSPRHLLTICFVFSLLFPFSHQSFQGMLSSLHSELDIQRYLMKIRLPHRVSQPFLYLTCILECVCSFLHALTAAWPLSFFFPDTPLSVPVKTHSDGLLNRFVCRTSHKCQRKLIKVLQFFIRLHMQECEEQSLHVGVFSKEEATVRRPLQL